MPFKKPSSKKNRKFSFLWRFHHPSIKSPPGYYYIFNIYVLKPWWVPSIYQQFSFRLVKESKSLATLLFQFLVILSIVIDDHRTGTCSNEYLNHWFVTDWHWSACVGGAHCTVHPKLVLLSTHRYQNLFSVHIIYSAQGQNTAGQRKKSFDLMRPR